MANCARASNLQHVNTIPMVICNKCKIPLASAGSLKRHMRSHNKFACVHCNKQPYATQANLDKHIIHAHLELGKYLPPEIWLQNKQVIMATVAIIATTVPHSRPARVKVV